MSTADKLLYLQDTKSAIKDAIVAKGVTVPTGTTFREYADKIGDITTGSSGSETADAWVRPTEWLALPDNVDGVQKVSILNAIFDTDSELVALLCRGAYTVDWGDGVVENFADNVKAEHKYTYSDIDLNSDTVATFGYKQCIITITPQSGQNLTTINFNTFHSSIGGSASYDLTTGFLDIRANSINCTSLVIGAASNFVKHAMLEQCLIGELADTALNDLFYDCYSLQSVTIKDTSNVTSFASMHYNNYSLQKMPTYTFRSAGTIVTSMFQNCYSLRETYPLSIAITASQITNMFNACKSLKYISLSVTSNVNFIFSNVFTGCSSLEQIDLTFLGTGKVTDLSTSFNYTRIKESPTIDTSLCNNFSGAFQNCDRLTNLYAYNYSSATSLSLIINGCVSLKKAGHFNTTSALIDLSNMATGCQALIEAPTFNDTSGVKTIASMFNSCYNIKIVPAYSFPALTTTGLQSVFQGCSSLISVPNITFGSGVTSNTSCITSCHSLKRMLTPLKFTFSVSNAKMSATALNEMYSILPTVTGQTVTVTGNYGVSGDNPTIATSKGWTVVG